MSDLIVGRNACMEALKGGRKIRALTVLRLRDGRQPEGSLRKILAMAKEQGIRIQYRDRADLDKMAEGAVHQGVIAQAEAYEYAEVADMLELARQRGEAPLLILLDGVEDPHNLGAIMRTAECAGAHGIIIPKRRAAAVTETVLKTSAGAAEHILCAQVTNLTRTMEELKEHGIWIYGCDMGETRCWDTDLTGPAAIVIGNEGKGVSRLVRQGCDFIVSIPMFGQVGSLNASNAAAVVIYEAVRQRQARPASK